MGFPGPIPTLGERPRLGSRSGGTFLAIQPGGGGLIFNLVGFKGAVWKELFG